MRIIVAADHGGFGLKNELKTVLERLGHTVTDLGTNGPESTDYPDYAHQVAKALQQGSHDRGLLVCGTGVGMAIAANRHAGVRAVNCTDTYTARLSRLHNDTNVLSLGARVIAQGLAEDILTIWLATLPEDNERHRRRVQKIEPSA